MFVLNKSLSGVEQIPAYPWTISYGGPEAGRRLMAALLAQRLLALLAVLFGLAVIVFILQAVIPADPARAMVGASAPKSVVEAKRHELGYDKPLPQRFLDYIERLAQRRPAGHRCARATP